MSESPASVASASSRRSSTRCVIVRHASISSRRLSAVRRTCWAARWSDQKSGVLDCSSSSFRRADLASRSKTPRGRVDPLREIAQMSDLHQAALPSGCPSRAQPARQELVTGAEVLEQDRTELDDAQRSLAPSDDGVDTRTVSVVWTDSAVAIAIERHGVAAVATFALASDQVNKRFGERRRLRLGIHGRPDSSSGPGHPRPRERVYTSSPEEARPPERVFPSMPLDSVAAKGSNSAFGVKSARIDRELLLFRQNDAGF
jgi:hypothetical protein